jgi:AraC family transcriptional regulator
MLVDHHKGVGESDVFETHVTSDVTLVVSIRGQHRIDVVSQGRWRSAVYQPGASGLTPSRDTTRMRWNCRPYSGAFETAHLYLPIKLIEETAEEYRRAGVKVADAQLSSLIFQDPVIAPCAMALLRAIDGHAPDLYAEHAARWLASHLLLNHARWWDPSSDRRSADIITDRRLERVIDFMCAHIAEPLTMARLAKEAGISVHHFARRFREQTGLTPSAYLLTLRIEAAKRLLGTTDLPVAEIGASCGYSNPAAFGAMFLRHVGVTPRLFRESNAALLRNR